MFCTPLAGITASYGRTTARLTEALCHIAFACGGEAGARLAGQLAMPTSADSLLRAMRRAPSEQPPVPHVLGVDDWAFCRGKRYGTILCDLERHRPIDLLPERSSQGFASWLTAHPGVQIISRDRGDDYKKGASSGAPEATQVADRWHLLHNLREALVRIAHSHHQQITKVAKTAASNVQSQMVAEPETASVAAPSPEATKSTRSEQIRQSNRARRLARYEEVIQMRDQGKSQRTIARQLQMSRGTVRRFIHAGCFPQRATRQAPRRSDAFVSYLQQRWDEGCHNAAQLTRELRAEGIDGSYHMVRLRVAHWRQTEDVDHSTGPKPASLPPSVGPRPSANRVSWLMMKQDIELDPEEQTFRELLWQCCPDLEAASLLACEFGDLVRERRVDDLQAWIDCTAEANVPTDLRRFADGLTADLAAVNAAVTLEWSNGQVEGQINRLKLVKRQMYGRANFDLLKARYLHAG